MILSFNKRFKGLILNDSKIHTIRDDVHDRWRIGRKIHFATGTRTKNYECFMEGECKFTQVIELRKTNINRFRYAINVLIDNKLMNALEFHNLIRNDGFNNEVEFVDWFFPKGKDGVLRKKLIHWTGFKY